MPFRLFFSGRDVLTSVFYPFSLYSRIGVAGIYGGSNEDRTRYLIVANDALSQMSYGPAFWLAVNIISLFL